MTKTWKPTRGDTDTMPHIDLAATRQRYEAEQGALFRLEAMARGKRCIRCLQRPTIAWLAGTPTLRCGCYPAAAPVLNAYDPQKERLAAMVDSQLARSEQVGNRAIATLTAHDVRTLICPLATDVEIEIFLRFCRAEGLNPLVNDAYLIKYDRNSKAAIVVGAGTFLKRAARHPDYRGMDSGIVVKDDAGHVVERSGSMEYPGDILLGGWAAIHMAGRQDFRHAVSLKEYGTGKSQWRDRPATMIEKVAYAQALKRCIPEIDLQRGESGDAITVNVEVDETAIGQMYPDTQPKLAAPTPQAPSELETKGF